jgi:hypothetical protein
MAMKRLAIVAFLPLLPACGSDPAPGVQGGESGTYAVDTAGEGVSARMETADGTATMRSGADVPVDLPDGFTVYPGAQVTANTVFEEPGSKGALLTMEADAAPEAMIAFYRRQAEGAGVDLTLDMTTDSMRMIGGKAPDGSPFSFTATPSADGPTTAQLMAGEAFD